MAISRRRFVTTGALAAVGLGGLALGGSAFAGTRRRTRGTRAASSRVAAAAAAAAAASNKIVVVVNLYGGNDGLNTLVPLQSAQYNTYRTLRPTLRYDLPQLLALNGQPDFGLNPAMTGFQGLFNSGKMAILNGVSVPDSAVGLFDHETGQYEFQSCDLIRSVTTAPTGWLGRYLDTITPGQISPGIDLGGGRLMLSGNSSQPVSINSVNSFKLQVSYYDSTARRTAYGDMMAIPSTAGAAAELNRQYRQDALAMSNVILASTASYVPTVTYPQTSLGDRLEECAKIIYGNVGARALAVGVGGFDMHSDQNRMNNGNPGDHELLLGEVSDAVTAFYTDLVNLGLSSDVLILTISEFGRRAYENGDKGTDHGLASVAFAVGDDVNAGIYGLYPNLNGLVLDGNLAQTTDFRSVYSTIIGNYLNADPVPILGGTFPTLNFV